MSQIIEVKVPDIGDFKDVPVIDVLVNVGDSIKAEDSLITLESDKAAMDVPSPADGVIKEIKVKPGDKVSEGSLILLLEAEGAAQAASPAAQASPAPETVSQPVPAAQTAVASQASTVEVKVPDIGDFKDVPVIDVLVNVGDSIKAEDSLITLESDKAAMDVPSPADGVIKEIRVKAGDKVSEGSLILLLQTQGAAAPQSSASQASAPQSAPVAQAAAPQSSASQAPSGTVPYGSPSVRKMARILGVNLSQVNGTGRRGRITKEDVQNFKATGAAPASAASVSTAASSGTQAVSGGGLNLIAWPQVDFAKFGPIDTQPMSRIKKLSAANLQRNWVTIPHVTQYDEADITDLEIFRKQVNADGAKEGIKVTLLAFVVKACVAALQKFPAFNSSLVGDDIVLKQYYNIGVAVDTKDGLLVPVIKNADKKGVVEIAAEIVELAVAARSGKLKLSDMQGGTFTITSLGGLGGTAFTPIVNAPEVAILGLSNTQTKAVWNGEAFVPRSMLPLSLSYDHRAVDGALGAKFTTYLTKALADIRRALL